MPVTLQCEHCEKNIEVPDELTGQMGECPHCGHSMYIPLADGAESEALELTDTDVVEESQMREEMERSRQTMRRLWSDRQAIEAGPKDKERTGSGAEQKAKPIDPEDAGFTVEQYVVAMARSSLDEAEALAAHLVGNPQTVNPIIKKALNEGLESVALKDVPEAVQKGFLKKLFAYLN